MNADVITVILGFIEGFSLIISPCILPVLPIFLAGSLTGSKKRPMGIITGFTLFFALIVFFSRQILHYLNLDLELVRHVSYGILILLGIIMMSSYLTDKFSQFTSRFAHCSAPNKSPPSFFNGLFLGAMIAIVWTPCAGPILAAVIVQTVIQQTTFISFLTLLAFGLGCVIPMFIISIYGQQIMHAFDFFKTRTLLFRKILGSMIIACVLYMIYFEGTAVSATVQKTNIKIYYALRDGLWHAYQAPPIGGIDAWINSPALKLNDLKGKVVLLDFWTYSCINCTRTLPYLNHWYQKYRDKGLVIIGVHSPEFDFEKKRDNVERAVKRHAISYPVALDNQFTTWRNFSNSYWPAQYLIDKNGFVVYQHVGEGADDVIESNIRFLLGIHELSERVPVKTSAARSQTAETYLGFARADKNLSPKLVDNQRAQYHFSANLSDNAWQLDGLWQVEADRIISISANARIRINFNARRVFMVMGSATAKPIDVDVRLNKLPLLENKGGDVRDSRILVGSHTLYDVVSQQRAAKGILEITAHEAGLEVYTYTFGN